MKNKSTTVRLGYVAHQRLLVMAEEERLSLHALLEILIERHRRERFLAAANVAYGVLRADRVTWGRELKERRAWDVTLTDASS